MKKYRVNVNGTDYEITLEEVTGAEASKPSAPVAQPAPAAAPAPGRSPRRSCRYSCSRRRRADS